MDLRNANVLLTGASGGLGDAIAVELHRRGAALTVTARRRDRLEDLSARTGAEVVVADLADRADVDMLCERAAVADVLIANAGIGGDGEITELTTEEIDRFLDVNLRAPIVMATAFAQAHDRSGTPGHIVTIGSLSGLAATPGTRMYNATKFGLRGFSLALRQDLAPLDIGVTHVAPGFIRDAGMFAENEIELPPGVRTKSPEDVGRAVADAVEKNSGEVFVAPTELRALSTFSTIAPGISAAVQRRMDVAERTRR